MTVQLLGDVALRAGIVAAIVFTVVTVAALITTFLDKP